MLFFCLVYWGFLKRNLNELGKREEGKNGKSRLDLIETFRKEIFRSGNGTCHNNYSRFLQAYSNDNNLSISLNSFMKEYIQKRFNSEKNTTYSSSIFLTPEKSYSSSYYCLAERHNLNTGFKQSCNKPE